MLGGLPGTSGPPMNLSPLHTSVYLWVQQKPLHLVRCRAGAKCFETTGSSRWLRAFLWQRARPQGLVRDQLVVGFRPLSTGVLPCTSTVAMGGEGCWLGAASSWAPGLVKAEGAERHIRTRCPEFCSLHTVGGEGPPCQGQRVPRCGVPTPWRQGGQGANLAGA